jgi:hypothetical protein
MNSKILITIFVLIQFNRSLNGSKLEKPSYKLVNKLDETGTYTIEIREYERTKWVSSKFRRGLCDAKNRVSNSLFHLLNGYRTGKNDQAKVIEMTTPVLTLVKASDRDFLNENCLFSMRFYLPSQDQVNTPIPNNKNLKLLNLNNMRVGVIRFKSNGYPTMRQYIKYRNLLRNKLKENKITSYDKDLMLLATYDSPRRFKNRLNEVWLFIR